MDRALIITLSNIGDLVMTTPVMESVAKLLPPKSMDVLADSRSSELLKNAPYISSIFHRFKRAGFGEQFELLRSLRSVNYDLIVDLRTVFLPYLLRSQHRCIKRKNRSLGKHSVEQHYSSIVELGKFQTNIPDCKIHLDKLTMSVAKRITDKLPAGKWLAIAPGANWPGKKWPAERFGELIVKALGSGLFSAVLVIGSKGDLGADLKADFSGMPVLDLRGQTDLNLAAAILSKVSLFVGNDSGLGHMANAVGVNTLTLFGPGEPEKYRPWGRRARVLISQSRDLRFLTLQNVWQNLTLDNWS